MLRSLCKEIVLNNSTIHQPSAFHISCLPLLKIPQYRPYLVKKKKSGLQSWILTAQEQKQRGLCGKFSTSCFPSQTKEAPNFNFLLSVDHSCHYFNEHVLHDYWKHCMPGFLSNSLRPILISSSIPPFSSHRAQPFLGL